MSKEIKVEDILSHDVLNVLAKNDVSIDINENSEDGWCAELEFWTPRGGDEVQAVRFPKADCDDNCDSTFCNGLEECYENFDIDGYVTMWLKAKETRKDICPLDAVDLVEEAKWIDNFLYKLYKQAEEIV